MVVQVAAVGAVGAVAAVAAVARKGSDALLQTAAHGAASTPRP